MVDVLLREAQTGFARLAGTRVSGSIPVAEGLLNQWVRQSRAVPAGVAVEVHDRNRLVVRFGLLHATARLDEHVHVGDGAPQIGIELASTMLAWALSQAVRLPPVRIHGRRVTIDLGALPRVDAYRAAWPCLRRARLRTTRGRVDVDFEVAVS